MKNTQLVLSLSVVLLFTVRLIYVQIADIGNNRHTVPQVVHHPIPSPSNTNPPTVIQVALETSTSDAPVQVTPGVELVDQDMVKLRAKANKAHDLRCKGKGRTTEFRDHVHAYKGPLPKAYKVLCWVMAYHGEYPEQVTNILYTWGHRCDKVLLMSDVEDPELNSIDVHVNETGDNNVLIEKAFASWKYIHEHYREDYDFFVKADVDSYLIVDNLRYYLDLEGVVDRPFYSGRRYRLQGNKEYFTAGGPGSILNRKAFDMFICEINQACPPPIQKLWEQRPAREDRKYWYNKKPCVVKRGNHEDVMIGRCLQYWNVIPENSRDASGADRFHVFNPRTTFTMKKMEGLSKYWEDKYQPWGYPGGKAGVSEYSAGFHKVKMILWTLDCELYPVS